MVVGVTDGVLVATTGGFTLGSAGLTTGVEAVTVGVGFVSTAGLVAGAVVVVDGWVGFTTTLAGGVQVGLA